MCLDCIHVFRVIGVSGVIKFEDNRFGKVRRVVKVFRVYFGQAPAAGVQEGGESRDLDRYTTNTCCPPTLLQRLSQCTSGRGAEGTTIGAEMAE